MPRIRRFPPSPNRVWLGRFVFVAVLVGVFVYVLSKRNGLDTADKLANIGALMLGAVTLVLTMSPTRAVLVDERSGAGTGYAPGWPPVRRVTGYAHPDHRARPAPGRTPPRRPHALG